MGMGGPAPLISVGRAPDIDDARGLTEVDQGLVERGESVSWLTMFQEPSPVEGGNGCSHVVKAGGLWAEEDLYMIDP